MLSKVIAWGPDRPTALARLDRALAGNVVLGVGTNTTFLRSLLRSPDVVAGRLDTGLIERELDALVAGSRAPREAYAAVALHRLLSGPAGTDPWDAVDGWRLSGRAARTLVVAGPDGAPLVLSLTGTQAGARLSVGAAEPVDVRAEPIEDGLLLTVGDRTSRVLLAADGLTTWAHVDGGAHAVTELPATREAAGAGAHDGDVLSPMPGAIIAVPVAAGAAVVRGEVLVVVEAMKMEHALTAPHDGRVDTVDVRVGDQVTVGQLLVTVSRG
jgi:acetyl-CoA/propionyl-CoA carboxylase biotin carboxyl carrier protein